MLISGPVAGGKSTLLQSLVGNTEQLAGALRVPQSVAFQPQVLFIALSDIPYLILLCMEGCMRQLYERLYNKTLSSFNRLRFFQTPILFDQTIRSNILFGVAEVR